MVARRGEGSDPSEQQSYRADLAAAHNRAFGFHTDNCAPDILALSQPNRARDGLVLEIGCGSGLRTRHLLDADHRVIASRPLFPCWTSTIPNFRLATVVARCRGRGRR